MATEIERKFLVRSNWSPADVEGVTAVQLQQGYLLASPTLSVRVRSSNDAAWLTIKGASTVSEQGLERLEFEYPIPLDDAEVLLTTLCNQPVIDKTRYSLVTHGMLWTVDVFAGENAGLVLAEVELTQPEQTVTLPDWVIEDVSSDGRYSNAYLSKTPFSSWSVDSDA
jgi:CYTH domain-containing protein